MKKSKFNLSYLNSTTGDAGYLIPFFLQPTLPNDSFRISLSSFIRAQPMLAPLMHEVKFYTQYWFVPYRLIWDDWEQFITGGNDLTAAPAFPTLPAGSTFSVGSLGDYFGYPTGVDCKGISIMPFRAYAEIWNTRYRDEDLQTELSISYASGEDSKTSKDLKSPSWKRDYFTTARPFTQRGGQISVPIGSGSGSTLYYNSVSFSGLVSSKKYSVSGLDSVVPTATVNDIQFYSIQFLPDSNQFKVKFEVMYRADGSGPGIADCYVMVPKADVSGFTNLTPSSSPVSQSGLSAQGSFEGNLLIGGFTLSKLSANLVPSGTTTIQNLGNLNIRDLRASSALQRYAERSLLWGNRYEEFIQREFGIKPRDSRIQRPEYLGGGSGTLQISEVLQTAEGSNTGVGTMRGHGVAGLSQRPIKFRCPEHGLIIGLLSIRPVPVYTQGVNREFLKKSRLDFFTPELANIGMQEVLQRELFVTKDNANTVFGYSDRYQEYRYNMPKVTGEFRGTLNFWNMARNFSAAPVLNESFINMSNSSPAFKRPFASQSTHSFLMMLRNNVKAYRPIPKRAKNILK